VIPVTVYGCQSYLCGDTVNFLMTLSHSFMNTFSKYVLSSYKVLPTLLGNENIAINLVITKIKTSLNFISINGSPDNAQVI
jgi:hypothetical protein